MLKAYSSAFFVGTYLSIRIIHILLVNNYQKSYNGFQKDGTHFFWTKPLVETSLQLPI